MADDDDQTTQLQAYLDRMQAGDGAAFNELLHHTSARLQRMARKMLRDFPAVRRWEQTDDVLQNALLRLHRALAQVRIDSVRQFFGLAATQIRRELIDMVRHYYGAEGLGANHATDCPASPSSPPLYEKTDDANDPDRLADWSEFHRQVEILPEDDREVFDLLWYHGLSQAEAARLLKVTERTVKRRWRSARLQLHQALKDQPAE